MPSSPLLNQPTLTATAAQAVDLLAAGKLLAVPTETVYGIALDLRSSVARERVRTMKNLSAHPGWVIHVASPENALEFLPRLSPLGRRMMQRAWPGPVAVQVHLTAEDIAALHDRLGPAAAGETILNSYATFRCPEVAITRQILSEAADRGMPVAIIGAATAGVAPADELAAIPPAIAEQLDGLVDGGPTRYRKPSTLVRIDDGSFRVVRPGVIDERIIQRLADLSLLFVCSGNTCRSPMAAALARRILAEEVGIPQEELPNRHIVVQSAGLHAARGMRAAWEAVHAMQSMGADLSAHQSQPVTLDALRRADAVYTMTEAHRQEILQMLPGAERKVMRLDPDADIDDPIGSDEAVYQQVAKRLEQLIRKRLSEITL